MTQVITIHLFGGPPLEIFGGGYPPPLEAKNTPFDLYFFDWLWKHGSFGDVESVCGRQERLNPLDKSGI
jgi:hypothetical protein